MSRCLALMLLVLAPEGARAQEDEAPPAQQGPGTLDQQARAHFQSASAYFDTGDYESAIREFRAAYDLSQRTPLLFNIYMAYERLGDFAHAIEFLERFLAEAESVENRPALELRLTRLRERAARGGGATPPSGNDLMLPAIVSFAGGGLGVALFAVFGSAALVEDSNLSSTCGTACSGGQVGSLVAYTVLADVGWILALVGAGLGTTFLLLNGGGGDASAPSAAIVPWLAPDAGGVVIGGRL